MSSDGDDSVGVEQLDLPLDLPAPRAGERRHVLLGERLVEYSLRRGRRRRLGLVVDQRGLRVGAPLGASLRQIEQFLLGHAGWIVEKLAEWRPEGRPARMLVCDGAPLPLLGAEWRLGIVGGAGEVRWGERELVLALPPEAEPRAALVAALRTRVLALLRERAAPLAPRLPCAMPRIALSNAQTRWGSCSRKTGLRFNWRLIHLPLALIDYVVAHELAHLSEMNHSPRFWSVLTGLYPDWRDARAELRSYASRMPEI